MRLRLACRVIDEYGLEPESKSAAGSRSCEHLAGCERFECRFLDRAERGFSENPVSGLFQLDAGNATVPVDHEANCRLALDSVSSRDRRICRECCQQRHAIGIRIHEMRYARRFLLGKYLGRAEHQAGCECKAGGKSRKFIVDWILH